MGFLFHLALIIFVIFKNRYYYNFLSKGHEVGWVGSRVDLRIVGKGASNGEERGRIYTEGQGRTKD